MDGFKGHTFGAAERIQLTSVEPALRQRPLCAPFVGLLHRLHFIVSRFFHNMITAFSIRVLRVSGRLASMIQSRYSLRWDIGKDSKNVARPLSFSASATSVGRQIMSGMHLLVPNGRTDRRGRPVASELDTDAARPRSLQ
jgi:hypothetical protein